MFPLLAWSQAKVSSQGKCESATKRSCIEQVANNTKGGIAHISTDTTGFGVRDTVNLLLDHKMLERLAR